MAESTSLGYGGPSSRGFGTRLAGAVWHGIPTVCQEPRALRWEVGVGLRRASNTECVRNHCTVPPHLLYTPPTRAPRGEQQAVRSKQQATNLGPHTIGLRQRSVDCAQQTARHAQQPASNAPQTTRSWQEGTSSGHRAARGCSGHRAADSEQRSSNHAR